MAGARLLGSFKQPPEYAQLQVRDSYRWALSLSRERVHLTYGRSVAVAPTCSAPSRNRTRPREGIAGSVGSVGRRD